MVYMLIICLMLSTFSFIKNYVNSGVTQDQTSSRPNTLFDDADDIQKQLDYEARNRIQFGRPKTIWVFHLPGQFPEISTEALSRNPNRHPKSKPTASLKGPQVAKYWEYSGQSNWSAIYPECGDRSQSPIDLPPQGLIKAKAGRQLVFSNYDAIPEKLTVRDDGRRLILYGKWKQGHRPLVYGGAAHSRRYLFHSLALHVHSEHLVGGFQFPMETQLIHISAEYKSLCEAIKASPKDPLAILGISNLYMFGNRTQSCLKELLKISANGGVGSKSITRRPLSDFSPPFTEYVVYQGSLTAPPCTESVLWMVRARSLTISKSRITWKDKSEQKPITAEHISKLRSSQSPISIKIQKCPTWTTLEPLKFKGYWDNQGNAVLSNTGTTAYYTFETATRPRLNGGPLIGEYIFEQMHFHWSFDDYTGCEHIVDGQGYAAECHLVHYNSKYPSLEAALAHPDGLAVVGFLMEVVDAPNPRFDKLVEGFQKIKKSDEAVKLSPESLSFMNRDDLNVGNYVTYKGSLTTPPYTECVTWILYEKPVQIGNDQLNLLRQLEGKDSSLIDRNVRPTQKYPPGHSVIYVQQAKSKL